MKETGIPALTEWGKNRPMGLTVLAQQAAVGAEALYKWLRSINVEELLGDYASGFGDILCCS